MGPRTRPALGAVLLAAPLVVGGCSSIEQLAAGPVTALEEGRDAAWGGAIAGEVVVGKTSVGGAFTGLGAGARAAVTERALDLAPYVTGHAGTSVDRTFFDASLRLGPGLQVHTGTPLGLVVAGASLGVGYAIADSGWQPRPWAYNPWGIEAAPMPLGGPDVLALEQADRAKRAGERERSRVLLTMAVTADTDLRFTRSPMLTLGVLVGLAWMEEVRPAE